MKTEELELKIYRGVIEEDNLLYEWWRTLSDTKDIDILMEEPQRGLFAFTEVFRSPSTTLIYTGDPIWIAVWMEQAFLGKAAFLSTWIAEKRRGTKDARTVTKISYEIALRMYPVIFSITRDLKITKMIEDKIGYTTLGHIPELNFWLSYITRKSYKLGGTNENSH